MSLKKILHDYLKIIVLMIPFIILTILSDSQAEMVKGKVTSIQGNVIELNLGNESGLSLGDLGKIYYVVKIDQKEVPIFIAKIKITHLLEKSSKALIEEKTGEIRVGYFAEMTTKEGELEVRSEPSGAKVYLNGKEVGETPLVLTKVKLGRHQIRLVMEGYHPYEVSEVLGIERKKVMANMKIVVKEATLEIRSDPTGAKVSVNGKGVGETPLVLSVKPGRHLIEVQKEGYGGHEEWVEVIGADRRTVFALLRRLLGRLLIHTDPSGADIYIDGQLVGKSPYDEKGLAPKTYKVRVVKEGYEVWEKEVVVEARKKVEILPVLREKKREVALVSPPMKGEGPKEMKLKEPSKEPQEIKLKEPQEMKLKEPSKEVDWSKKIQEAPVLKVGDHWTYKNAKGETWTQEVRDIKQGLFFLKIRGQQELRVYDQKTMNLKFLINKDGRKESVGDDPFKNLFNFPIFVGKKWAYMVSAGIGYRGSFNKLNEFEVKSAEEISMLSGTYMTYHIFYKQKYMGGSPGYRTVRVDGWVRYWYSPEVKAMVKREVEKSGYWESQTWLQDLELISYKLK